jgi:hypothetical protein
MSQRASRPKAAERKRRYLVHLIAVQDDKNGKCLYVARSRPWSARPGSPIAPSERTFSDECELIETVNPLLLKGSDVRDVMGYIESPEGFLYLLSLTVSEAASLGWPA